MLNLYEVFISIFFESFFSFEEKVGMKEKFHSLYWFSLSLKKRENSKFL
jgi:hypothetical protein